MEVSIEELVEGYQRNADYHRKTQALTEQRKQLEARETEIKDLPTAKKTYEKEAENFVKNSKLVLAALEQRFMPKAPEAELLNTNSAEYIRQKEAFQEAH